MSTKSSQTFESSSLAWEFMRRLDAVQIRAGFPTLVAPYQVSYTASPEGLKLAESIARFVRMGLVVAS